MRNVKLVLIAMSVLVAGWSPGTTLATESSTTTTQSVRLQELSTEFLANGNEQGFWQEVQRVSDAGERRP